MTDKLTGDLITYGTSYVTTIEVPSKIYGKDPDYKIAVDIKPIKRTALRQILQKFGIKDDTSSMDINRADEMMVEVCKLGIVDPNIVAKLDDLLEFLPAKIGAEILALSTGSGSDLENFSKPKKL
jgi:hypothetical protein